MCLIFCFVCLSFGCICLIFFFVSLNILLGRYEFLFGLFEILFPLLLGIAPRNNDYSECHGRRVYLTGLELLDDSDRL